MAHKTRLAGGWTFVSGSPSGGYDSLGHVAVLSENDAWAVGRLSIAHWNGTTFKDVDPATTNYRQEFNSVWGSGPNDVWATSWGSSSPDNLQLAARSRRIGDSRNDSRHRGVLRSFFAARC